MFRLPTPVYTRPGWHKNNLCLKSLAKRIAEFSSIWIPENGLFLRVAVSTWADKNISDWNGTEKDARGNMKPPTKPWLWTKDRNSDRCLIYDGNDDEQFVSEAGAENWWVETEPVLIEEWEAELQASKRWHDAVRKFRGFLASGHVVGQILTDSGELVEMPEERWRAKEAQGFFSDGFGECRKQVSYMDAELVKGAILIDRSAVQDIIDKKTVPVQSQPKNPKSSIDEMRFPYLAFMLQAAAHLPSATDKRVPKKDIEYWLRENWPSALGDATQNKISDMARFLRRPIDEKGGNH